MMNRRNERILLERGSREERKSGAEPEREGGEIWDNDPRYVFLA